MNAQIFYFMFMIAVLLFVFADMASKHDSIGSYISVLIGLAIIPLLILVLLMIDRIKRRRHYLLTGDKSYIAGSTVQRLFDFQGMTLLNSRVANVTLRGNLLVSKDKLVFDLTKRFQCKQPGPLVILNKDIKGYKIVSKRGHLLTTLFLDVVTKSGRSLLFRVTDYRDLLQEMEKHYGKPLSQPK